MSRPLTRRDLLLGMTALGASGATVLGRRRSRTPDTIDTLQAVADVIYPPSIDIDRSFIDTSVRSRVPMWDGYFTEQESAIAQLTALTRRRFGQSFVAMDLTERDRTLKRLGVRTAHPIPDGTPAERIRFYVINDLLYALYAHPMGGELVGCENPPGYQGGRTAYQQRGPS